MQSLRVSHGSGIKPDRHGIIWHMGDLRQRLKAAVEGTPIPPGLHTRVQARMRARLKPRIRDFMLPAVGVLAACGLLLTAYGKGYLPVSYGPQASYIASVCSNLPDVMKVGLGDHIHCAVFRKYPDTPPTPAEFVEAIGPKYASLVPIVQSHTPSGYHMLLAHQCHYLGRKFIHIILGDGQHLLSLVITAKGEGETLKSKDARAAQFRISDFESAGYLVYFISDLPGDRNAELLASMAPEVKAALEKA